MFSEATYIPPINWTLVLLIVVIIFIWWLTKDRQKEIPVSKIVKPICAYCAKEIEDPCEIVSVRSNLFDNQTFITHKGNCAELVVTGHRYDIGNNT